MTDSATIRHRFDTLEEMAANLRHWDVDFKPLAADHGGTELTQIALGPLLLSHLDTGCRHIHFGASPPGAYTFALLADPAQTVHLCRQRLDDRTLPFFGAAQEFEASAHPRFNIYTLTLDAALLDADPAWQAFRQRMRESGSGQRRLIKAGPMAVSRLRNLVAGTLRLSRDSGLQGAGREALAGVGEGIARTLLATVGAATPAREKSRAEARSRAVRQALVYLQEHAPEAVNMNQLCRISKVSERTLQRAFLEHFGVTPKAYIRAQRLNDIRAELLSSRPGEVLIRDLAIGRGFWHMGQFAHDYQRLFGELPSRTLETNIFPSRTKV